MRGWILLLCVACGPVEKGGDTDIGGLETDTDTDADADTDTDTTWDCATGPEIQIELDAGTSPVVVCPGVHEVTLSLPDGAILEGRLTAAETTLTGTGNSPTVYVDNGATATMRHLTVSHDFNPVDGPAGGIDASRGSTLTLEDVVVSGNNSRGTALAGPMPGLTVLTDVVLSDNVSELVGGAVLNDAVLTRVVVQDNTGTGPTGMGGLYILGPTPEVTADASTIIRRNTGAYWGGGVTLDMYTSWTGGQISENHAPGGGGIALFNAWDITISDVTLADNTADYGAGLYPNNCCGGSYLVTVSGATITGNDAVFRGGGMYWFGDGDRQLLMSDTVIADNLAEEGAGIYSPDAPMTLTDTTLVRNIASISGGGVQLSAEGSLDCTNCDLGDGLDDNLPDDVVIEGGGTYSDYGAGANFVCDSQMGICLP